jgi:hypothetical protein
MRPIRFESASVPKTQWFSPQPAGRHRRSHLATFLHDNAAHRRVIENNGWLITPHIQNARAHQESHFRRCDAASPLSRRVFRRISL